MQTSDHTAFLVAYGPISSVSNTNNYKYLLPSLDLNLDVTDDLKVRFDASRTLTRPPLNLITPVTNRRDQRAREFAGGDGRKSGPAALQSDNVDLGAEWYYARNSYLSADVFVKEVTNFIVGGTTHADHQRRHRSDHRRSRRFSASPRNINGPSAEVRGVELAVQHMFWDTGFGLQANATFVSTNKPYNPYDISAPAALP